MIAHQEEQKKTEQERLRVAEKVGLERLRVAGEAAKLKQRKDIKTAILEEAERSFAELAVKAVVRRLAEEVIPLGVSTFVVDSEVEKEANLKK